MCSVGERNPAPIVATARRVAPTTATRINLISYYIDIVTDPRLGATDPDLGRAVALALERGDPAFCAAHARAYTWANCTRQFLANLVDLR